MDNKQVPNKNGKGTYLAVEVAFKNQQTGKLESKKLFGFGAQGESAKKISEAKQGDCFVVTTEKNAAGYWDWVKVEQVAPGQEPPAAAAKGGNVAPKSTYETPEERAKKQVYIVRQSALSNAVALLTVGAKIPPSHELIVEQAQKFVDWVFNQPKADVFNEPNDLPEEVQ